MRVVSLIPAGTEIVCALGVEDALVGRSHECDHPPGVRRLPALTEPKFAPDGTSYRLDQRVRALVQEGLSVYRVDAGALAELQPDVVVTQEQCEVCAADRSEVEDAVAEVVGSAPAVTSLSATDVAGVWDDVRAVAEAVGVPGRGEALAGRLRRRMVAVAERAAERGRTHGRPSVALVEWLDPLMAAGNWMPELVSMAGGRCLFGEAGSHSPWLEWEALLEADPDVIVLLPCGFGIARTMQELPALTGRPGWLELRAVRADRVAVADGHHFFNRPGPRLVESLEILAEILHLDELSFGHEGTGWIRLGA